MPREEPDRIDRDQVEEAKANTSELREAHSVVHLPQEIPVEDPQSKYTFKPQPNKPFLPTPATLDAFGVETILICLARLQQKAACTMASTTSRSSRTQRPTRGSGSSRTTTAGRSPHCSPPTTEQDQPGLQPF